MTRREVLTNIVCAYVQCGSFPKLDPEGNFNPAWYATVEAICKKYPEKDEPMPLPVPEDYWAIAKTAEDCACSCKADSICSTRSYDY